MKTPLFLSSLITPGIEMAQPGAQADYLTGLLSWNLKVMMKGT